MIRFTAKDITIEIDEPEDVVLLLKECLSKLTSEQPEEKRSNANAERCKRYRENKKHVEACHDHVTTMSNHVENTKEEREEKEEVLPFSPSSLSSSPSNSPINYPITPISPLPEEKEEREENVLANVPKAKRDRGILNLYGWYVLLSDKELNSLIEKFGSEKTKQMIDNMNNYIGEDPKRIRTYRTRNHYLTLLNWERMDQDRKQPKQIPKEKTFHDIAVERGLVVDAAPKDDFIDSFWRN